MKYSSGGGEGAEERSGVGPMLTLAGSFEGRGWSLIVLSINCSSYESFSVPHPNELFEGCLETVLVGFFVIGSALIESVRFFVSPVIGTFILILYQGTDFVSI